MKRSSNPDGVASHRIGRRMFGDYPISGIGYWLWLAAIVAIGLFSVVLMFTLKA